MAERNVGKITQIIGAVLDIKFPEGALPEINSAIDIQTKDGGRLVVEVAQHLGDDTVRCIAMGPTDGLVRGMEAESTGSAISVPVGEETLGRMFNVLGEPIDNKPAPEVKQHMPIHRKAPTFAEQSTTTEMLETGIKVVDLLCPYQKGGKIGLFGGAGVGSGIVINGQMVYGHDGFAGELGHVIARRDGRLCGCGRKGCLETYCSATGVARTAREFLAARTDASLLRNIPAENITSKDVYDAAVQGDKLAQEIFEFTGNILGEALADAIAFSSPEAIVLFGGLAKSGDYIMKPIQESIDRNILNIYKGKTKLLVSELKDSDAAVLGASALAWELKDLKE